MSTNHREIIYDGKDDPQLTVVWDPINGQTCGVGNCNKVAYKKCDYTIMCGCFFKGCGRYFCMEHSKVITND